MLTLHLSKVTLALAALGLACAAQAAPTLPFTVPAGVTAVKVTLTGGGGGGGGGDSNGAGGAGFNGALLDVQFPVTTGGVVTATVGGAGGGGKSWTRPATLPDNGAGGAGDAPGGHGSDSANTANPGANGSGGGGGGGGASSVSLDGVVYARAAGGGGGGGGGWNRAGLPGTVGPAAASTANCANPLAGGNGVVGAAASATDGGGAGGGGGGYASGSATDGRKGPNEGADNGPQASGGFSGASCVLPAASISNQAAAGGGPGGTGAPASNGPNPATPSAPGQPGTAGAVKVLPNPVATSTAGDAQGTVTWSPPTGYQPADVSNYTVTCTPGVPVSNPVTGTSLPLTGLTNGTPYSCDVTANMADGSTSPAGTTSFTPQAAVPPGTVTPNMSAGDSTVTIGGTLPPGTAPADVANYTVTCNPALPITNPVTTLPITVPATNGTNYVCSVDANLTAGGTLASNGTANATPNAPAAVTPVPTLGEFGLLMLGGLLAAFGLRRRQRG